MDGQNGWIAIAINAFPVANYFHGILAKQHMLEDLMFISYVQTIDRLWALKRILRIGWESS